MIQQTSKKYTTRIRQMLQLTLILGIMLALLTGCGMSPLKKYTPADKKETRNNGLDLEKKNTDKSKEDSAPENESATKNDGDSSEEAYNGSGVPDVLSQETLDKYMRELEPADDEIDYKYAMDYQGYDVIGFFTCRDAKGYPVFFGYDDVTLEDIQIELNKNTNISQVYKDFIYDYAVDIREHYPEANLSVLYTNLPTLVVDEVTPTELARETQSLVGEVGACYIAEENRICVLENFDLSESDNYIILSHELTHAARKYRFEEMNGDAKTTRMACFYTPDIGGIYAEEAIITNMMYELEGKGNKANFYPMVCNYYRIIQQCIDYSGADYFNHDVLYLIDKMDEFMGDTQYAWEIIARIDAQMDLRYNPHISVDFHDFQPIYEYLAKMYFKKYITDSMTYDEAKVVFDAFYDEISHGQDTMTRKYAIDENTFLSTFEEYIASVGIAK